MQSLIEQVAQVMPWGLTGSVSRLIGLTIAVTDFPAPMGAVCAVHSQAGRPLLAQVIGFQGEETLLLPYGELGGIRRGQRVELRQSVPQVRVGPGLLGRIVDGLGNFLDDRPSPLLTDRIELTGKPISPLHRPPIDSTLGTGVRALDGLLTVGHGQRLGIFAGSGVGKSTLLGQLARSSTADVNVVVLVGERGREVQEFILRDLGPEGLARSVVVAATSNDPALARLRAAYLGTAYAEYFRDQGRNVLLMMDSVTRFALAQREIGLAAGEPPATRGYPPSVFALLPRLLERSGRTQQGSITGLYTVLVDGDDTNEPISDAVRGILDGHVVLSRKLGQRGHWPAIDVLASISRLMSEIAAPAHKQAAQTVRQLLAIYAEYEDLISIGAYQSGTNPLLDVAIQMRDLLNKFLQQGPQEKIPYATVVQELQKLAQMREGLQQAAVLQRSQANAAAAAAKQQGRG